MATKEKLYIVHVNPEDVDKRAKFLRNLSDQIGKNGDRLHYGTYLVRVVKIEGRGPR